MSRPEPAGRLQSGQTIRIADLPEGDAHVLAVWNQSGETRIQLAITVPSTHPVWVDQDAFQGLVDELEAWGGA